jgi:hypothetical protein
MLTAWYVQHQPHIFFRSSYSKGRHTSAGKRRHGESHDTREVGLAYAYHKFRVLD